MKSTKNLRSRIKQLEEVRALPGMGPIEIMNASEPGHKARLSEHMADMHERFPGFGGVSIIEINQVSR